jgi:stage V sporulation protein B
VCLALVIGDVISEIVSFIYTYFIFILDKKKYLNNLSRENSNFWGKIFKITIPVSISSYIRSGLNTLSQILIPMRIRKSGISYEYSLSQYGIISGMVMPIILFASVFIRSFSGLLIPEFSNYKATQNYKRMSNVIKRSFNLTFIFSILISGILWNFCTDISNLFYKSTDISIFIKILSPLVVLIYIDNIIDSILKGLNKQTAVMVCNIVDLLVSISFIWFLLPIFGITGYIIVIFISELLNCSISFFELMRVTKFEFNLFGWIIKPAAAMLISNLFISVFKISGVNNMLDLILNMGIYIGFYLLVLIRI